VKRSMPHNNLRAKSCLQRAYAQRHSGTYTASALTMMSQLRIGDKVRCHTWSVDSERTYLAGSRSLMAESKTV
jgi:hypothetical protein